MTITQFAGVFVGEGVATPVATGDYHATDPAAFKVETEGAVALAVIVNIQQQTGSGNTLTITISGVTDEGSGATYPLVTKAISNVVGPVRIELDPRIAVSNSPLDASVVSVQQDMPAITQVACVGSGTRTTLVYDVSIELVK